MRSYSGLGVRAFVTLGLFVALSLLSAGSAFGADKISVHVYSAVESRLMSNSRQQMEQQYPKGSLVYYLDEYQIDDGPNSLTVNVDTTFNRDRNGVLRATDVGSGYTWTFSPRATIERKNNVGETILHPGQTPDAVLQRLISLGGARFGKVLTGVPKAGAAASPFLICPAGQIPLRNDTVCGPPPPTWGGGGPGTADPGYLRAISNNCAIRGKSIVSFSYVVAPISYPSITTSFCAALGGVTLACYYFSGDSPGSPHNRSVTYNQGGDVFGSLGFHWSGGDNNGAGSGNAPGCSYGGGCS